MRKRRVAELERKGRIGKEIEIFVERKLELDPSHNLSEVTKLSRIAIAPDGKTTYEVLIDKKGE